MEPTCLFRFLSLLSSVFSDTDSLPRFPSSLCAIGAGWADGRESADAYGRPVVGELLVKGVDGIVAQGKSSSRERGEGKGRRVGFLGAARWL